MKVQCSICDNHFTTNEEYKDHITKHFNEIETMNFTLLENHHEWVEYTQDKIECNMCEYKSSDHNDMRTHIKEHIAIECEENM